MRYSARANFWVLTGAACLMAACATVPDLGTSPDPKAVASYSSTVSFAAPATDWPADGWWQAYGDAQLTGLIETALQGSPTLAQAKARVLKAQAAELPHKSEQGVLALGLASAADVQSAYREISGHAHALVGPANVAGILVEKMVEAGLEMLIGITRDPALGVFLTVGRGGSQAEALRDVQFLPAPASPEGYWAGVADLWLRGLCRQLSGRRLNCRQ